MNPDEAVALLGGALPPPVPLRTSTGSLGLDLALGGWPVGQVSEIYGPAFCGKTTLALSAIPAMQELGTVAYVTLNGDFNPDYAERTGIDIRTLLVLGFLPPHAGSVRFWVVDSLSDHLQVNSLFWQDTTVLAVSQVRAALGDPYRSTTGGYIPEASARVRVHPEHGARHIVATVARGSAVPESRSVALDLDDYGLCHDAEVFDLAVQAGVIARRGNRYYLGESYLGNGREAALRGSQGRLGPVEDFLRAEPGVLRDSGSGEV